MRWYPTNCGTQPYGDHYAWESLPTCPDGYHIPELSDVWELMKYPSVWDTNGPGNVPGLWVCSTEAATSDPSTDAGCVFFPLSGYSYINSNGEVTSTFSRTKIGFYWTSTISEEDPLGANTLSVTESGVSRGWCRFVVRREEGNMSMGIPVRCIK